MELRKEVVDRLLLAKSLLNQLRFHSVSEPDSKFLAGQILTAHDAAELALAALCDQFGALPAGDKQYLMNYFEPLKQRFHTGRDVSAKGFFSQLNRVRTDIKHHGILPDPKRWTRVGENVYDYVSEWSKEYLEVSFDELDEAALLSSTAVRGRYDEARGAISAGNFQASLELLAIALFTLLRENAALRGLRVGQAKPEDAIRLSGFGVHGNSFLALQEFLPECNEDQDGKLEIKWRQNRFGHPGNWNKSAAEFCADTFLDVALKIQNAGWIPGAVEYVALYEQKIMALRDGVEIFVEEPKLPEPDATTLGILVGGGTQRKVVKTLQKGETLRATVTVENHQRRLMSGLYGTNDPEKYLVTILSDSLMFGYVLAGDVKVTSVPRDTDLVRKYFPWLMEMEWTPD